MSVRLLFAGDRAIAVEALQFLVESGVEIVGLALPGEGKASHARELMAMCPDLDEGRIWRGTAFRTAEGVEAMRRLEVDYMLSVHFPLLVPKEVLEIPRLGVLNLHPAYLPFNRGWHTATWAILDGSKIGATLHFMSEGVDTGDIVARREVVVRPEDTADVLYQRVLEAELEMFKEAWPAVVSGDYERLEQDLCEGSSHQRRDLEESGVRRIDVDAEVRAGELLRRLRGLTTNRVEEAAYFEEGGSRYLVQVKITSADGVPARELVQKT